MILAKQSHTASCNTPPHTAIYREDNNPIALHHVSRSKLLKAKLKADSNRTESKNTQTPSTTNPVACNVTTNRVENSELSTLQTNELVNTWLSTGSIYINPAKTYLNKLIKWTTSKYADQRKSDIVDYLFTCVTSISNQTIYKTFSSGPVVGSDLNKKQFSYSILVVNNTTLLRDNNTLTTYRFINSESDLANILKAS